MKIEVVGGRLCFLRGALRGVRAIWGGRWGVLRAVAASALVACSPSVTPDGGGSDAGSSSDSDGMSASTDTGTDGLDASSGSSDSGSSPSEACPGGVLPGGWVREDTVIPSTCEEPEITNCKLDFDRDGVPLGCDNASDVHNPAQRDADGDGFGDRFDLCPVIAAQVGSANTADSDSDGFGNECDSCPAPVNVANVELEALGVPGRLLVRNNPLQRDSDGDGVGDACDNCPSTPNCAGFGESEPATVFDAVPRENPDVCQQDADFDGVGDACQGQEEPRAAGPAGFGENDDFDQDGLRNGVDGCPRIVVASQSCSSDEDCNAGASCVSGQCNHADADGDGVGDACDTCVAVANPDQHGVLAGEDDADGDFIGLACEVAPECGARRDAPAPAFFTESADGLCCVRTYPGDDVLTDPDGRPLRFDCGDDPNCTEVPADTQRRLGVGVLPPGCEAVLADACVEEARPVTLDDVDGDLEALWSYACRLPALDQDADGIGDLCDLCPFDFDPTNAFYVDDTGREWPNDGAFCNGDYATSSLDPANGCMPGGG